MFRRHASAGRSRVLPRYWPFIFALIVGVGILMLFFIRHTLSHAEPILRAKVIQTLSERFKGKVELAEFHVSVGRDLEVFGKGLKIFAPSDPNPTQPGVQPLIAVDDFHFATAILAMFHSPLHVGTVFVKGMTLNVPPREQRGEFDNEQLETFRKKNIQVVIDHFVCEDTQLIINTLKPGKLPLVFAIRELNMRDIGPGQPVAFEAMLVNPKPVGDIHSTGHFGPFHEQDPRATPVAGEYSFSHAELQTLKGISGTLSSTGKYQGVLGKIEVEGSTDTPDFRVTASGGHPVNLHTDFQATVDGSDGDTYLHPVKAHFSKTSFIATGKVVKVPDHGHDIEIDVVTERARIEDFLMLGVKSDPPVLSGNLEMHTRFMLPPGPADFAERLALAGHFKVTEGLFSNEKIQDRIDSISLRSQGKPEEAKERTQTGIRSELDGEFQLKSGIFTFSPVNFSVPGTTADVTGTYSLDGKVFDFQGKVYFNAKLSQMTTGWKSLVLRAVDPFTKGKDGKGTQIPFRVTGAGSEPHFGLDFGHEKSNSTQNHAGSH